MVVTLCIVLPSGNKVAAAPVGARFNTAPFLLNNLRATRLLHLITNVLPVPAVPANSINNCSGSSPRFAFRSCFTTIDMATLWRWFARRIFTSTGSNSSLYSINSSRAISLTLATQVSPFSGSKMSPTQSSPYWNQSKSSATVCNCLSK